MNAGSRGDNRTRLRQDMLQQLFEDHVMELLLTMSQHASQVSFCWCLTIQKLMQALAPTSLFLPSLRLP